MFWTIFCIANLLVITLYNVKSVICIEFESGVSIFENFAN